MPEPIPLALIGPMHKMGQGGQGVVYRVPSIRTSFAKSMVYKAYKAGTLSSLNIAALRAMPTFLESLPYAEGAELINLTAWPCAVVEDESRVVGFVMPAIPDEFYIEMWTNKPSPSLVSAEVQHLLNDPHVLAMRFRSGVILDRQRYELLGAAALALKFLHGHGVCVGDISPKNLLFALQPTPAVFFVDCDAMRVKGVSLAHQVETPGWEVPSGEEKATVYSDRYKLGLLGLRLLTGRQDGKDPTRLAANIPNELRRVITATLTDDPPRRPSLDEWIRAATEAAASAPAAPAPSAWPPSQSQSPVQQPVPSVQRSSSASHGSTTVAPPVRPTTKKRQLIPVLAIAASAGLLSWGIRDAFDGSPGRYQPPASSTTVIASPTQTVTETATATQTVTRTAQPSSIPVTTTLSPTPSTTYALPPSPVVPITPTIVPITPTLNRSSVWGGVITGTCDEGGSCGVKQRTAPFNSAPRLYSNDLVDSTIVAVVCVTRGDTRSNRGYGTSDLWFRLINGSYIPAVYIDMRSTEVPSC